MADATRLADDEVGCGEGAVDTVQAFFQAAVVVQEAPALALDRLAIGAHRPGTAADTEHALAVERFAGGRSQGFVRRVRQGGVFRLAIVGWGELSKAALQAVHGLGLLAALGSEGGGACVGIFGAAGQGLALAQFRHAVAQPLQLGRQAGNAGIPPGLLGTQFGQALAEGTGFAGLFMAGRFGILAQHVDLAAQLGILGAQGLQGLEIGTGARADLMLDHVDVAVDLVFEQAVAGRVRPCRPQGAGQLHAAGRGFAPELAHAVGRLAGGKAADGQGVAFFQCLVQQLGQPAAVFAGADGRGVQHEVAGVARQVHDLVHQAAQLLHCKAAADHRAMELVGNFPQLAPAGGAGRFRQVRQFGLGAGQEAGVDFRPGRAVAEKDAAGDVKGVIGHGRAPYWNAGWLTGVPGAGCGNFRGLQAGWCSRTGSRAHRRAPAPGVRLRGGWHAAPG